MKKILCVLVMSLALCGALFAQAAENAASKNWYENIRLEAEVPLLLSLDFSAAYEFPINSVLRWDAGLDVNFIMPDLLTSLMAGLSNLSAETKIGTSTGITAFASFWFWDFYTRYGLGLGFTSVGGSCFVPFDFRLGWEPGSRNRDKGFFFKMETGFYGGCLGWESKWNKTEYDKDGKAVTVPVTEKYVHNYPFYKLLSLGVAYKF